MLRLSARAHRPLRARCTRRAELRKSLSCADDRLRTVYCAEPEVVRAISMLEQRIGSRA